MKWYLKLLIGLISIQFFTGCATNQDVDYSQTAEYKKAIHIVEQRKIVGSKEYIKYHKRLKAAKLKREKDQKNPQYIARMKKLNQTIKQREFYAKQQQKIYNDPRVVAAQIQANATMQSAYIQQQQLKRMQQQQMWQNMQVQNSLNFRTMNDQFYRNLNTINNNTAAWWRYTH